LNERTTFDWFPDLVVLYQKTLLFTDTETI
jgi:hypothetical protein